MSTCSRDWSRAGEAEVREVPCKADVLIQEQAGEELEGGSDSKETDTRNNMKEGSRLAD